MSIIILDGGMGQELLKRSSQPPSEMWSAKVLMDEPELVIDTHLAFIEAGADVITINAYAASLERLTQYGYAELFHSLQERAIDCAARARAQSGREVKITGSIPPLFTSYNPDPKADFDFAINNYREIVEVQKDGVDVLLAETLGSMLEVRAALTAMEDIDMAKWLSVTIADDAPLTLRSGEALEDAVWLADEFGVSAFLLNCSTPEAISKALPLIASPRRTFGAYANGFQSVPKLEVGDVVKDKIEDRHDLSPDVYADFAGNWVSKGATLIGGCCNIGPEHIAELKNRFGDRL